MADAGAEVLSAGMERWCVAMEKEALRMFHKLFHGCFGGALARCLDTLNRHIDTW